jgi:hypothetical protein
MENMEELLEGYSPRDATEEELALLSYVVGKNYESCQTFEIDSYSDEAVFPYFFVSSGDISYGSETMGFGEMSLHLMLWQLNRIQPNSILLIEEPETYISPRSQNRLMDVVAKVALQKGLWVIITTHSPNIVSQIPNEHIKLLFREGSRLGLLNNPGQSQLESVLGIIPTYKGILLVEDESASFLSKAWLQHFAPDVLSHYEIVIAGSEGEIINALQHFPKVGPWLTIIGLFDGDSRVRVTNAYNWRYAFLPGELAPEQLMRAAVRGNSSELASRLGRSATDISLLLGELEGDDHHDWFTSLAERLFITRDQLMDALFSIWYADEENRRLGDIAVAELLNILND